MTIAGLWPAAGQSSVSLRWKIVFQSISIGKSTAPRRMRARLYNLWHGLETGATNWGDDTIMPMSDAGFDLARRPRRLRLDPNLRRMLQRVTLRRSDVIVPVFVRDGMGVRREISSMPGVFQMSVDVATEWLSKRAEEG